MEEVFNLEKALKRTMGDRVLLSELVIFTFKDMPEQLRELEEFQTRGEAFQLKEAAHKLKGSAGAICADRLFLASFELEQLAAAGDLRGSEELLEKVKSETEVLKNHPEITELKSQA